MLVSWTQLKSLIGNNLLPYKYIDPGDGNYYLFAVDLPFQYECTIAQDGGDDQIDFETNYKNNAMTTINQMDIDGAMIVRLKAAKKGWTYASTPIEIITAKVGADLYSKLPDGITDRNWTTVSTYDVQGNPVISDPGDGTANATITETIVDFEPPFDYEIIGGELRSSKNITDDVRLWIVAVPDVPAQFGGSKEMAGGINLKYLVPGNVYSVDGRVTKALTYDSKKHTGKIRLIFRHPAGVQEQLSIVFEIYKQ